MGDMCMMSGMMLMLVMVLRLMMVVVLVVVILMMMMGVQPDAIALSTTDLLFLLVARAESSAILLVPCAQGLATKH